MTLTQKPYTTNSILNLLPKVRALKPCLSHPDVLRLWLFIEREAGGGFVPLPLKISGSLTPSCCDP